jgi:hypothetical protein
MKHLPNARARAVAKSVPRQRDSRDPLWVITIGMGAFFVIVAALLAIG